MQQYSDDDQHSLLSPRLGSFPSARRSSWSTPRRVAIALSAFLLVTVVVLPLRPVLQDGTVVSASDIRHYIHNLTADENWPVRPASILLDDDETAATDEDDDPDAPPSASPSADESTLCEGYPDVISDYGISAVRRSRRYEGSGARVRAVIDRAKKGEQVKVAVIGGSVSTGHGAIPGVGNHQYGAIPPEKRWHRFVVDWFASFSSVPPVFLDGAKPAVDSGYFEWCWSELIGTEADLVMIETAVNDEVTEELRQSSETLLRSIMSLPQAPAVMYVDAFATRSASGRDGLTDGGDLHGPLAAFYDIPHISIRAPLLANLIDNAKMRAPYFRGDGRHIAEPLHRALGRLVVSYLQDEMCALDMPELTTEAADELWPPVSSFGKLPTHRMKDELDSKPVNRTPPPRCIQAGTDLVPATETDAWRLLNWKDSKFYYESKKVDKSASFDITLGPDALGNIAISFLRSWEFGLGRAECSVAGQTKVLDGHWTRKTSLAQTRIIASGLAPGPYTVECKVLKPRLVDEERHSFRIIGVMGV